ncbi:hypothetical protein AB0D11_48330 [Streptomyces monashensis]|uniref:hypothetical protein n=1 Tax=Streptomyces monashensis TaxID=1678012 RepID=UPI0033CDF9D9
MIVGPGGGYAVHADHETEPLAAWLTGLELSTSVFRNPLNARHPDLLLALRTEGAYLEAVTSTGGTLTPAEHVLLNPPRHAAMFDFGSKNDPATHIRLDILARLPDHLVHHSRAG